MEIRMPYLTQSAWEIPAPAQTVTVDGVQYDQAGIVIDGVVYLRSDYGAPDIKILTGNILAQLRQQQGGQPTF